MALSSVHVVDPEPLPTALRPREATDQEERPQHEAKHNRDRAAVLLHPNPQGLQHCRGKLWQGRVEADEPKHWHRRRNRSTNSQQVKVKEKRAHESSTLRSLDRTDLDCSPVRQMELKTRPLLVLVPHSKQAPATRI